MYELQILQEHKAYVMKVKLLHNEVGNQTRTLCIVKLANGELIPANKENEELLQLMAEDSNESYCEVLKRIASILPK